MAYGPGKYDDLATHVLKETGGSVVAVIVLEGKKGNGFAVQARGPTMVRMLPSLLRQMGDQIEADGRDAAFRQELVADLEAESLTAKGRN